MKRRIVLLTGLLTVLVGCRSNTEGPLEVYRKNREGGDRADLPGYTISEQRQRGRERYSIVEDDFKTGPAVYIGRPDPVGSH